MVGLKIKRYLDANGIKYSYLSDKIGMSMNILSPTLNGKRKMSAEEYFMICEALGVSADTFQPTDDDAPRTRLSVNKIENGYAECNVRLTAAGHKK